MTGTGTNDWDPGTYHRFRGLRLRPALDLIRALPPLPEGAVVDLGCGSGAAGDALRALGRRLTGVDLSAAMLDEARAAGAYDALVQADISDWRPEGAPALIFSNAALHWVGGHDALLRRLAAALAPGGVLAVQVPHQNNAPSHRLWRALVQELYPGKLDETGLPQVLAPAQYHHLLSGLGRVDLWETEYYQMLDASDDGHPVRHFTQSTYARPILRALDERAQARLVAAYDEVIGNAYPTSADGRVLFPFRRMFFTLVRD